MAEVNQMGEGRLPSIQDLFKLDGKQAIVTGGTGGLGLSMTVALAEAGADIVSIQMKDDPRAGLLKEACDKLGRNLIIFQADVADSKSLRQCFQSIWDKGIIPDILLNCAGINRRSKVEDFTDEDIDAVSPRSVSAVKYISEIYYAGLCHQSKGILCLCSGSRSQATGAESTWKDNQYVSVLGVDPAN